MSLHSPSQATLWQTLLPAAMVGTDKKTVAAPLLDGAVGALLAQVQAQAAQPALALLQMAGVLAVCERAGGQGQAPAAQGSGAAACAIGPEEWVPLEPGDLHSCLHWLLTEAPQRLQIELFQRLHAARRRLPVGVLPLALDTGSRSTALRPSLVAVLGERGRWLARHSSHWRYAIGTADSAPAATRWQEGTLAQRVQLLQQERATDPSSARQRLQAALPDLPAKERADLVAVLHTGLSADDEALLTTLAQQDRGREVRQNARALLVQLPTSVPTLRAIARVQVCLEQARPGDWRLEPPQAPGEDWKVEGLEAERPKHESMGERAWWLYQLARQVPLAWWPQHTGMAPDALVQWASQGDWHEALVRAWLDVLKMAPETAWCHAFLEHWPGKLLRESPATVLALLPAADREPYWLRTLQAMGKAQVGGLDEVLQQIVAAYPPGQHLSLALSQQLLEKLPLYLHRYYHLPLAELCCVLHPDTLAPLLAQAQQQHSEDQAPGQALAQALRHSLPVLLARRAFAQLPAA